MQPALRSSNGDFARTKRSSCAGLTRSRVALALYLDLALFPDDLCKSSVQVSEMRDESTSAHSIHVRSARYLVVFLASLRHRRLFKLVPTSPYVGLKENRMEEGARDEGG